MQKSCDSRSLHQELQQIIEAAEQDDPVLASSTSNIERCHDLDPFGGGVVGGLDGDYAYGSLQIQDGRVTGVADDRCAAHGTM